MSEEDSSVDRVRQALYKRGATSKVHARRELHSTAQGDVAEGWGDEALAAEAVEEDPNKVVASLEAAAQPHRSLLGKYAMTAEQAAALQKHKLAARFIKTLFVASALFFLFAAGYAAYIFSVGPTQVGCSKVRIQHTGPLTIASGKELVLNISVTNENPVTIHNTELLVDFPEGARSPDNPTHMLPPMRQTVGSLDPGESVNTAARAALYGREQEELEMVTTVQYSIEDSNAEFICEQPYRIIIATAPVNVEVDGLEEISSNQELELTITVSSNSEKTVPNVRLVADYPFGYEHMDALPKPTTGESVWDFGNLGPGDKRTITTRGIVTGVGTEARSVRFSIGEADTSNDEELETILQTLEHPLLVTRPFLDLDLWLNDSNEPVINTKFGQRIDGELRFTNNLDYPLHDIEIESKLPGVIVNPGTVRVIDGFYRSVDNTMLWTPATKGGLALLRPGESGSVSFSFSTFPLVETSGTEEPSISLTFDILARRISDNIPVPQRLTNQAQHTVRFTSDVDFKAYATFAVGPFSNAGPHPPIANNETTYTINLEVANSFNDIEDAVVEGTLPVYVSWQDIFDPSSESLSYNPVTRAFMWKIGDIKAKTGNVTEPRKVSFQVSIIPSITQIGGAPALVHGISFRGVDHFTGDVLEQGHHNVTTATQNDPFFPRDSGVVRQ